MHAVVYLAFTVTDVGWACEGQGCAGQGSEARSADPARIARRAELVGAENCSWTTGIMAQRVLEQGVPWTFVGTLVPSENDLPSKVAAPYTVGPEGNIHVVANEVLEHKVLAVGQGRVSLVGRLLEVEGIKYFVATG